MPEGIKVEFTLSPDDIRQQAQKRDDYLRKFTKSEAAKSEDIMSSKRANRSYPYTPTDQTGGKLVPHYQTILKALKGFTPKEIKGSYGKTGFQLAYDAIQANKRMALSDKKALDKLFALEDQVIMQAKKAGHKVKQDERWAARIEKMSPRERQKLFMDLKGKERRRQPKPSVRSGVKEDKDALGRAVSSIKTPAPIS